MSLTDPKTPSPKGEEQDSNADHENTEVEDTRSRVSVKPKYGLTVFNSTIFYPFIPRGWKGYSGINYDQNCSRIKSSVWLEPKIRTARGT
jgi:hypothetical protein